MYFIMEHDNRFIGLSTAKKLASALDCDYIKFLYIHLIISDTNRYRYNFSLLRYVQLIKYHYLIQVKQSWAGSGKRQRKNNPGASPRRRLDSKK